MKLFPSVLTDFNVFTPDNEYRGDIHSIELPTIEWTGTEIKNGLGVLNSKTALSNMTAKVTSYEFLDELEGSVLDLSVNGSQLVFMGSHEHQHGDECTVQTITVTLGGNWRSASYGSPERGSSDSAREYTCEIAFIKLEIDGKRVIEIDTENVRAIGPDGVDQLAKRRSAIGM